MCSIYGVLSEPDRYSKRTLDLIAERAKDRGRDGGKCEVFDLPESKQVAVVGNWRATPTPELDLAPFQPYDGIVHNGTIANDAELGGRPGEVDSMVLPRVLDRLSLAGFARSLERIEGSYAIAAVGGGTIYLASNYKPIWYWQDEQGARYFSSLESHFQDVLPFGQAPVQVKPYSVMDLRTGESINLPRNYSKRALVVASAGLDSTVVATHYASQGYDICLLHMDYGCRAKTRESERIAPIARELERKFEVRVEWEIMDLPYAHIGGSTLLDPEAEIAGGVEGAEFAHEWVPARNFVMVAYATAYAEAHDYHIVALGNNLEEAGAYPDNEEQMFLYLNKVSDYAVGSNYDLRIESPVCKLMKREIVELGLKLGAPFELTWSCYRGGERHCGECGPCFMRRTAFERCGMEDPVFKEVIHDHHMHT